jgi:hypothetical protein
MLFASFTTNQFYLIVLLQRELECSFGWLLETWIDIILEERKN